MEEIVINDDDHDFVMAGQKFLNVLEKEYKLYEDKLNKEEKENDFYIKRAKGKGNVFLSWIF